MKKKIIALLASMTAACSVMAFAACTSNNNQGGGGTENPPAVDVGGGEEETKNYAVKIEGTSTSRTIDLDSEDTLRYSVTLNGSTISGEDAEITVSLDGDSIEYTIGSGSIKIKPVKLGKTVLTISLKNHPDVASKKFTYNVASFFFSRTLQRGDINLSDEGSGRVIVKRANDAASLVYKKASTHFVFKATIELPAGARPDTIGESFGVASFRDAGGESSMGDNALWFGARSTSTVGVYSIYHRGFYAGWGSADADGNIVGYENRNFGTEKVDIPVEIIRNGADYYYSINGLYGKFTDKANFAEETYPGIYSQHFSFIVKDFSVEMDEDKVATAAEAYSQKGYAAVSINEKTTSYLINGRTHTFTGTAYPTLGGNGTVALTWSIDDTELDDKGNTAIDPATGVLTIAEGATGYITVKCNGEGGISDLFRVRVRNAIETYSDSVFDYTGGVERIGEGTFVFPQDFAGVDGIGAEYEYVLPANHYYALSKNEYTGSYAVEFKLSNYTNHSGDKIEVTLGEGFSRFYISRQSNRVEAYGFGTYGSKAKVGWFLAGMPAGYNWNGENTFKIAINDKGVLEVYVNGTKLQFKDNETNANATIKKSYDRLISSGRVKVAANGVSATVTDFTITQGNLALNSETYVAASSSFVNYDASGFEVNTPDNAAGDRWLGKYHYITRIAYIDAKWSKLSGSYVIEYDVDFSEAMKDGKLILKIGEYEYHILNKYSTNKTISGYISTHENDWGNGTETVVTDLSGNNVLGVHVRLEVDASHNVKLYMNDVIVGSGVSVAAAPSASYIEFYTFCSSDDVGDNKITVSNLTLSDYSQKSGVLSVSVAGGVDRALSGGDSEQLNFNVTLDGNTINSGYTLSYQVTGSDVISLNETTRTVTGLKKGKASIVVTISSTNDAFEAKTVTIAYEVSEYEFHKLIHRGSYEIIKNADGDETGAKLTAGNSSVVLKKSGTQWVYGGTLTFEDYNANESISLGSFVDDGDHALWFGLRQGNGANYNIYIRSYYDGWGSATYDTNVATNVPMSGATGINFRIVRNGNTYYYTIGSYTGKFETAYSGETYPGLLTQSQPVTLSAFTVAYGNEAVTAAENDIKANTPMTSLTMNKKVDNLTSGESHTFEAVKAPAFINEGYTWSLDKSGLTAGADTVSIDPATGALTTGEAAVGTLKVIVTSVKGGCTDECTLTLTQEIIPTENDVLTVSGATLQKDSSGNYTIVALSGNGTGFTSESDAAYKQYTATDYGATLKQTVKGDFTITMTFSDFEVVAGQKGYLMLSLGGQHNQFYIVRAEDGTYRLQTFTDTITDDFNKWWSGGDYSRKDLTVYNSGVGQSNTLKVECIHGMYKITVNGVVYDKVWTHAPDDSWGGNRYVGARRLTDYNTELPVRISTYNASAKVTDITLVNSGLSHWYYTHEQAGNITVNSDTSITLRADVHGWDNATNYVNKVNYSQGVADNFTAEMDAEFSGAMGDGKLLLTVGNLRVMINNKNGNLSCTMNINGEDWGESAITLADPSVIKVHLKVVRNNGEVSVYVNGESTALRTYNQQTVTGSEFGINLFNPWEGGDPYKNVTVTVTNFSVA